MVRHSLRRPLAGLASALLLAACADGGGRRATDDPAGEVPDSLRYGGTVTVGSYSDLQTMNALVTGDANSGAIQRDLLFMPLVQYDDRLNVVPRLARWDTTRVKPDTLELTFHLRSDVRWHDGRPVTTRDVAFTYERARDTLTAYPNASSFDFYDRRAVVVDDSTIRFRFRPHAEFLDAWFQLPPMPEHVLGRVPPAQLATHPFGTRSPVGNGPFRFVRHAAGREWVFEANPDFPRALGGRPYLDRVVYRFVPEQTTLFTDLLNGAVDLYLAANFAQAERITSSPRTRLDNSPGRQWNWIAWNEQRPMFADARVRRALTMAIDRRQIVDALLFGYGEVGRSSVTPAHWSYDTTDVQTLIPYDTAGARRLLAEAGWQDRDGDGVLENAAGSRFRFTLKTNDGNQVRKDVTEVVQAQLARIGVQVEPRLVEWNTLVGQMTSAERDFDAIVGSWVDFFRKDDADIFLCRSRGRPFQIVSLCDPAIDRMIDSLNVLTDRRQAAPLWREYQQAVVQASPYTVLYYPRRLTGVSKRLHGVEMDVRSEYNTVGKWWIAPADRATVPARPDTARPDTSKKQ